MILKNFAIVFPAFYVTYYIIIAILCAIANVPVNGLEPFDHANFNPGEGGRSLGKFTKRPWASDSLLTYPSFPTSSHHSHLALIRIDAVCCGAFDICCCTQHTNGVGLCRHVHVCALYSFLPDYR